MEDCLQFGDWKKISVLGSGAFGEVTLFSNTVTSENIAVKQCKFKLPSNLSARQKERWQNEVTIMKTLDHPNVIRFKELPKILELALNKFNTSKLPILSMEYCTKGNLRRVLREAKNICGLEEQDVKDILMDLANGIKYLHGMNITHRDLKPDNVVLEHCNFRKSETIYKIIDLGYAKELDDSTQSFVGTLHYLAPEIFFSKQYNYSVDYWSLGILTFEIICGVLPFFPHLIPMERFQKIAVKDPDIICMYLTHSRKICCSKELKKEIQISNCLKENLEVWLQHVLQFDQNKRKENFPGNVTVLDNLQCILTKKIVTVLSIYKLEFYSYEYNESTAKSTLKDWVSRDTKIGKSDLLLLVDEEFFGVEDDILLVDVLKDMRVVYAFKKDCVTSNKILYNYPQLVMEMFRGKVIKDLWRPLLGQTIFYILFEMKTIQLFFNGLKLHIKYLRYLTEVVEGEKVDMVKNTSHILVKLECYNKIRKIGCDENVKINPEYKERLLHFQRVLTNIEKITTTSASLEKQSAINLAHFKNLESQMQRLSVSCNMKRHYESTVKLLQNPTTNIIEELRIIVNQATKEKDSLFQDKSLVDFGEHLHLSEKLLSSLMQFKKHVMDISNALDESQRKLHATVLKLTCDQKSMADLPDFNNDLPTDDLINHNHYIREKLAAAILEYNKTISICRESLEMK